MNTNKHSFNVTYVEGLLLLSNGVSVSVLHRQNCVLTDQNNVIAKLSCDLSRLNQELLEIKTVKALDASIGSTNVVSRESSYFSDFYSYIDPKILAGIVLTGAVYYGTPYLLSKIALPSLKSLVFPVKSAVVACLPFLKGVDVDVIDSMKDECVYRVILTDNKLSDLLIKRKDFSNFESVTDLLAQYLLQRDKPESVPGSSTGDNISGAQPASDSALNTSQNVTETSVQSSATEATDGLLTTVSENTTEVLMQPSTATYINTVTSTLGELPNAIG
jgi:hypothetical protein